LITIYGTSVCSYCTRAKNLAKRYGIAHEFKNIEFEHFKKELDEKASFEYKTVPQIWWNGRYIGGYSELSIEIENTIGGYGDGKI
jgi:glutaredoxin